MIGRQRIDHRRRDEPAVPVERLAAGHQPPAGGLRTRRRGHHSIAGIGRDDRSDDGGGVGRFTDHQLLDRGHECVQELGRVTDDYHPLGRGALLPGVTGDRSRDRRGRERQVGVRQHDRRVLAAHLGLHGNAPRGGGGHDRPPDVGRAGERDDIGRVEHRGARFGEARHDREQAGRQYAIEQFGHSQCARGGLVGRLEHDPVAEGERGRGLPDRDRQREVPRCDQPGHAAGTAGREGERVAGRTVRRAERVEGLLRVIAQDRDGPGHLTAGLAHWFADLTDDQHGQFFGRRGKRVGGFTQCRRTRRRSTAIPAALRPAGTGHGRHDLGAARLSRAENDVGRSLRRYGCDHLVPLRR